ncbi:MAG: histidinol-phosphatase HisJ family protein [Clostridiales bacterium]|nr:histidinol-phosphatase HisJ family protein [Clostridiales bacterium]
MNKNDSIGRARFIVDMHTHSNNSHDGKCTVAEMAKAAREKGLNGICITDHCDVMLSDTVDVASKTKCSVNDAKNADNKYGVRVFCGIEIGETYWNQPVTDKILSMCSYDAVIGSVHTLDKAGWDISYSQIDFSLYTEAELYDFFNVYLDNVNKMLDTLNFDILAHLTCPLRYINGRYKRNVDATRFADKIETILKRITERKIALEINTSEIDQGINATMPYDWIIKRYFELGGELITLGSDAHTTNNIGKGFDKAFCMLKSMGVEHYYCYENRIPQRCDVLLP